MLRLSRVFKNYNETGSLSEQINLYGFIGSHAFLTKSGEVGVILEVRGVDFECLDGGAIDGLTKRLESALKLFDENYRLYQYLFKRNNETIPYKLYANPIVNSAIKNRIAYLQSKADTLFSLSVHYVVLYQRVETSARLGTALAEFPKNPKRALANVRVHFSSRKQVLVLGQQLNNAEAALLQKARSFILQVSDFVAVRMLDKNEAFRVLKRTLNFHPDKLEFAKLKYDTFLDYYLPESPNGPDCVFIERKGFMERAAGITLSERALTVAVKNIARRLGDDISEAKPILDSRLPDGSRVAAVIPPCSLGGVTLTIRKFNARRFELEDLIRSGTLDCTVANRLEDYVLQRRNILLSGGTGTGKTTLLTALGKFIPPDERILLIEDTAEIQLHHENLVRFEARREQNGTPAVSIRDLLKAALRHRPDRILLGEIRSGEAFDLLQLLNTGHSGTLSTIHASSAKQGLARFTSCVLQSGVELPYRAVKTNIGDSLNVVVQIERRPGRRFVSEVLEINSYDPDADLFDFSAIYVAPREHP